MPIHPRAKPIWRNIVLKDNAYLEEYEGKGHFSVSKGIPVVAFRLRSVRGGIFFVPLNNTLYLADRLDAVLHVHTQTTVETTISDANDHNTCLFTCRYCGNWLKSTDEGYGTEHGWCGCEEER